MVSHGWRPRLVALWAHINEGLATLLPRFVLGTVIFTVVYGEIRLRTNSVQPAVLMHAVGNTFTNTLLNGLASEGFVSLAPKTIWLTSFGERFIFNPLKSNKVYLEVPNA